MFGFGSNAVDAPSEDQQQRKLLATIFQRSIESILVESTKHRGMSTLRDMAHTTRARGYPPNELCHTLAFACEVFGTRSSCRGILDQSINDLGKLFSLSLIPITESVLQAVCDVVRRLAIASAPSITPSPTQPPSEENVSVQQQWVGKLTESSANEKANPGSGGSAPREGAAPGAHSGSSIQCSPVAASSSTDVVLVKDEQLLLQLLQLLVAVIAACPLGTAGLAESLGLLFLLFAGSAKDSILEEMCTATLMGRMQMYCTALTALDAEAPASMSPQLHAVAFFKDLCAMAGGRHPKWVKLTLSTAARQRKWMVVQANPTSGGGGSSNSGRASKITSHASKHPITANTLASTSSAGQYNSTPLLAADSDALYPSSVARGGALPEEACGVEGVAVSLARIPHRLRMFVLRLLISYFTDVNPSKVQALSRSVKASEANGEGGGITSTPRSVDGGTASSEPQVDILFSQCLNEDIISLAVRTPPPWYEGVEAPLHQSSDAEASTSLSSQDPIIDTAQLFILTQRLALIALAKFAPIMRSNVNHLVNYHAMLLRRTRDVYSDTTSAIGKAQASNKPAPVVCVLLLKCMSVLMEHWRRAIAHDGLLSVLLSLSGGHHTAGQPVENLTSLLSTSDGADLIRSYNPPSHTGSGVAMPTSSSSAKEVTSFVCFVTESSELVRCVLRRQYRNSRAVMGQPLTTLEDGLGSDDREVDSTILEAKLGWSEDQEAGLLQAVSGTASAVDTPCSTTPTTPVGVASQTRATTSVQQPERSHRQAGAVREHAAEYVTDALTFLTTLGQSCARLGEVSAFADGNASRAFPTTLITATGVPVVVDELRDVYLALHPIIVRIVDVALEQTPEEQLHVILMLSTHWTHVSCSLDLLPQRDALLQVLVTALYRSDPAGDALLEATMTPMKPTREEAQATTAPPAAAAGPQRPRNSLNSCRGSLTSLDESPFFKIMQNMRQLYAGAGSTSTADRTSASGASRVPGVTGGGTTQQQQQAPSHVGRLPPHSPSVTSLHETKGGAVRSDPCPRAATRRHLITAAIERLQQQCFILKALFSMAKSLGESLGSSWILLAHSFVLIEPLIYRQQLITRRIDDPVLAREMQLHLLSDAEHLRRALLGMCVESAQYLSDAAYRRFLHSMVEHTMKMSDDTANGFQRRLEHPQAPPPPAEEDRGRVPMTFGIFWQWLLLSRGLSLAYLSVLPLPTQRAALTWQFLRRLVDYTVDPHRLHQWCRLLQAYPSSGGFSARPHHHYHEDADRGHRSSIPHERSFGSGGGTIATTGYGDVIEKNVLSHTTSAAIDPSLAELQEALTTIAEDIVVVSAYTGVFRGRLDGVLASGEGSLEPSVSTDEEESSANPLLSRRHQAILSQVFTAQLPSGPFVACSLAQLVANILPKGSILYTQVPTSSSKGSGRPSPLSPPLLLGAALVNSNPPTTPQRSPLAGLTSAALASALQISLAAAGPRPCAALASIYSTLLRVCVHDGAASECDPVRSPTIHSPVVSSPTQNRTYSRGNDASTGSAAANEAAQEAHGSLAVSVLFHILRQSMQLVQGYGEDLRGASWDALLQLIQDTVTVDKAASASEEWTGGSPMLGSASFVSSPTSSVGSLNMRAPSQERRSKTLRAAPWDEAVQLAFRSLELIQHNCITHMDGEALRELIQAVGAFIANDGIEARAQSRLHVNLSAVQLMWSVADYLATSPVLPHRVVSTPAATVAARKDEHHYWLWCHLLLHLHSCGCMDPRPEVRQSSLKSLYALVQTHGALFSADTWLCFLQSVLLPQMACVLTAQRDTRANPHLSTDEKSGLPMSLHHRTFTAEEDASCYRLLQILKRAPRQVNDMRITITDAASRVLLTHCQAMTAAMQGHPTMDKALVQQTVQSFIQFCADARVVVRETTGEDAALAAVHALHSLLVELPGDGLRGCDARQAREALAGLLMHRGHDPPMLVQQQCSLSVVVALVAAVCDECCVARQRAGLAAKLQGEGNGVDNCVPVTRKASTLSALTTGIVPEFSGLLTVLAAAASSAAVDDAYYFPNKVQTTLTGCLSVMWPLITPAERQSVFTTIICPQFPTLSDVQRFVVQSLPTASSGPAASTDTTASPIALRTILPRGAHPNALMHWVGWLRHLPLPPDDATALAVAPAILGGMGRLLTLQYASSTALAVAVSGTPFTIPEGFFEACYDLLQHTLWHHALRAGASSRQRRPVILALSNVFTQLLSVATIVVRAREVAATEASGLSSLHGTPQLLSEGIHNALQTLERLVMCLGDVVQHLMKSDVSDVDNASEIVSALVVASSSDSSLLSSVAQRSLATLRQWSWHKDSSTPAGASSSPQKVAAQTATPSLPQFHAVVRTSMQTRNRLVMQQYIANPESATAADLVKDVLHRITESCEGLARCEEGEEGVQDEAAFVTSLLPELVALVACVDPRPHRTSDEVRREQVFRAALSATLLAVHNVGPRQDTVCDPGK